MTIVQFPVSGLSGRDIAATGEFCADRRSQGTPYYLSVGDLENADDGPLPLFYASIKDGPRGRTMFIVDRVEAVYRARYWHSIRRKVCLVAQNRNLSQLLSAIPKWHALSLIDIEKASLDRQTGKIGVVGNLNIEP